MSFETLGMIVLALAVLLIVILFFRAGTNQMGQTFGGTTKNITGQTAGVTQEMQEGVSESGAPYLYCSSTKSLSQCEVAGGKCMLSLACTAAGGYNEVGYTDCTGPNICCCSGFGP